MTIVDVTARDWEKEVLQSEVLTVVDFWHETCPWCRKLNPVFEEIAKEYSGRAKLVKLNVLENQENREIAVSNGVMGTPTLIFYCHGRAVGTTVGFLSKENFNKKIQEILGSHKECLERSTELKS